MHRLLLSAYALALAACAADVRDTADFVASTGRAPSCAGAFTPLSEVCYDSLRAAAEPFQVDPTLVDETLARYEGLDRCARPEAPPGTPGTLTVEFDTLPLPGTYSPKNIGAVWIEDASIGYVRTLEVWAEERVQSLSVWWASACHDPNKDATVTKPDVITSATLEQHKHHRSRWNGRDFRGAIVPDGNYTLWVQLTESEIVPVGPFYDFPIRKGPDAWTLTPEPKGAGFANIRIRYEPDAAGAGALAK